MTRKLTPAQLDEIEAVARADIAVRVAPPTPGEPGRGLREVCEFLEVATSRNVLALVAEVRELRAKVERVRELHRENAYPDRPVSRCRDCDDVWPCETARSLEEEA